MLSSPTHTSYPVPVSRIPWALAVAPSQVAPNLSAPQSSSLYVRGARHRPRNSYSTPPGTRRPCVLRARPAPICRTIHQRQQYWCGYPPCVGQAIPCKGRSCPPPPPVPRSEPQRRHDPSFHCSGAVAPHGATDSHPTRIEQTSVSFGSGMSRTTANVSPRAKDARDKRTSSFARHMAAAHENTMIYMGWELRRKPALHLGLCARIGHTSRQEKSICTIRAARREKP